MFTDQEKDGLEQSHKTNRIIWAGMIASLVIYIFICHMIAGRIESTSQDKGHLIFEGVLLFFAFVLFVAAYFIRRIKLKRYKLLSDDVTRIGEKAMQNYRTALIIGLALAEAIGLYGLVVFFLGSGFFYLYLFMGLALTAQILIRPSSSELEAYVRAQRALIQNIGGS